MEFVLACQITTKIKVPFYVKNVHTNARNVITFSIIALNAIKKKIFMDRVIKILIIIIIKL